MILLFIANVVLDTPGALLDCKGGEIKPDAGGYTVAIRADDVVVKNCIIYGSVRVWGMATNGQGAALRESSYSQGHTQRAQDAAPHRVTMERVTIIAQGGGVPLYIAPGVTHFTFADGEIKGEHGGTAVYFDAESAYNTITRSYIHTTTDGREMMAIDGSAYNTITDNRFAGLGSGGIYLYRNCGEGGTVRHQSPKHNKIADNYFYYNEAKGFMPAIWIGSRWGLRGYCGDDDGYPFGSSASNLDYAEDNIVTGNQIARLPVATMIRVTDWPNDVRDNVTVHPRSPIGCGGREASDELSSD